MTVDIRRWFGTEKLPCNSQESAMNPVTNEVRLIRMAAGTRSQQYITQVSLQIDNTSEISLASIWIIEYWSAVCVLLYRWLCKCYRRPIFTPHMTNGHRFSAIARSLATSHSIVRVEVCEKRTHSTVNVSVNAHHGQKGENGIIKILQVTMKPLSSFKPSCRYVCVICGISNDLYIFLDINVI